MKLAWVVVLVVACKGKEADKTPAAGGDKPATTATPAAPPSGGPAPTKSAVQSGELIATGELEGTFRWKDDLSVTCTWIPDTRGGGLDVTMTDGSKFLAFGIKNVDTTHVVEVTSAALKNAAKLTSPTGFTMTGSSDGKHMSITVDTDVASKEGTKLHIKGKLELACI